MSKLTIIGWNDYDSNYPNINFENYSQQEIISLVMKEIKEHQYKFSGQDHQNKENCVPLFSNGCVLRCSMRTWAILMASANQDDNYMNYYMDVDEEKYPKEKTDIELREENDALPVLVGPDQQLIMDSITNDIELMTFDKAIKEMYPLYKRKHQG